MKDFDFCREGYCVFLNHYKVDFGVCNLAALKELVLNLMFCFICYDWAQKCKGQRQLQLFNVLFLFQQSKMENETPDWHVFLGIACNLIC